jgi:hypothetical protein
LTFLGERLFLDFEFCNISIKNSTFESRFCHGFVEEMKRKFNEKCNLHGTVKDIWSKSWTLPPKSPKKPGHLRITKEEMYHNYTQDMFTVKKIKISK